jgi:hypothetical protein
MAIAETEIEIKGIKIGMSQNDYEIIVPPQRFFDEDNKPIRVKPSEFTIAEIPGKHVYSSAGATFEADKLDSFLFFFKSENFDKMLNAVKAKYPKLKCENSIVNNAFGATFKNINCYLKDKSGQFKLTKYVDLETSSLSIRSHEYIKRTANKQKIPSKDL